MLQKSEGPTETFKMGDFAEIPPPRTLTGCISSQRSYGATRSNFENADTKFRLHEVQNGDTLQRISVKYGVAVERLKRVNKIWSNESLFLLETLRIPYTRQPSKWEEESSGDDDDDVDDAGGGGKGGETVCTNDGRKRNGEMNPDGNAENKVGVEQMAEMFENCSDFLSRIDTRIHKCKEDWTKIRSNSQNGAGVPAVSYDSTDAKRLLSPSKHYQHFGEKI